MTDQPSLSHKAPKLGNLLGYHTMASQSSDVPMHSTLGRLKMTWQEYVDAKIKPQMEWGLDAFCFHLPHGKQDLPGPMAFDAYLLSRKSKLSWAKARAFEKAIRPLTQSRVRVIVYVGSLDKGRMGFLRTKLYSDDNWIGRFARSLRPYINAGCEIAFDAAAHWKVDGPEHTMVRTLQHLGTPVHIEGTELVLPPDSDKPGPWAPSFDGHLRDLPIIANHQQLHDNIIPKHDRWDRPELYPKITTLLDGHSAPRNSDGTKRELHWIHEHAHEWAPPMLQQDLQAGYDCCMFMFPIILNEMTLEELVTR